MSIVKASGGYSSNYVGGYTSGGSYYGDYGAYDGRYNGYRSGYPSKYYKRGLSIDLGLVGELLGIEADKKDKKDQKVIVEKLILPAGNEKGQNVIDFQKKSMQAVRIKQPYTYIPTLRFKVQKDVKGLKYKQTATRAGILIEALNTTLGEFKASEESYDVKMPSETAQDGVEWLGDFAMVSTVVDEDNVVYLKYNWDLIIDTQWEPHNST